MKNINVFTILFENAQEMKLLDKRDLFLKTKK